MAEQRHVANPGNFAADRERAARAGHIGGQRSSGNFARDPARAAEAGRKGGQRSHGGGGSARRDKADSNADTGAPPQQASDATNRPAP